MSTMMEPPVATQRTSSWRDQLVAEYEISQARLRGLLEDAQEEYI